jgi:drug/metabolite transporter (DMT)-like permease
MPQPSSPVLAKLPHAADTPPRLAIPPAGLLQLAGSIVLLGGAWPITKYALQLGASPLWFAEGRAALSGLAAFVLLTLLRRLRLPRRRDLPALLAVGLLQLAAFFAFAHEAAAWVPAGRTAILSNVTTIFVVPLSVLVLRERISPRAWLSVGLGLAGIIVLMGPWAIDWTSAPVLVGHAFLLAAAGCWGCAIIVVRRFPPALSMLQLLPWCFALASAALLLLIAGRGDALGHWSGGSLAILAFIGLIGGPVGTWCVMQASVTLPALVASVGFLATPAAGLLGATLFLGERLGPDLLIGAALILSGVGVAAWPRRRA